MIRTLAAALSTTVCLVALAPPAEAQTRTFNIPAGSLKSALDAYARASGRQVIYKSDEIRTARSAGTHGSASADAALAAILIDTGFAARTDSSGAVAIIRSISSGEADAGSAAAKSESADIVVTGTHIRGALVTSPVSVITRKDIENAGQNDLGQVARSLPANFGGGQNPGVGTGAGLINSNLNSASNINLLGLGPDATLTLLNGHRLPYDGAFSGVDISAIPVEAIERIEIVTDGASAEYGSDAVAGVANVILRRDFSGLTTSARIGAATDGGDFEQQADVVAGTAWQSGGIIATYDFAHNSAIAAHQRDYASSLPEGNSLYPSERRHAVTVSAHQTLTENVEFKVDGLYSKRWSTTLGGALDDTGLTQYRFAPTVETFSITPEVDLKLGAQWLAKTTISYGQDNTHYNTLITSPGGPGDRTSGCYCNTAFTAEESVDGPLFALPGGDARLAIGGGYRTNSLRYSQNQDSVQTGAFDISRKSHYFFGEAQFPIVGPAQEIPLLYRLTVSAAARYEDYPGLDKLTTPKVGLAYEPNADLLIRASWGRSFKAPTLYQQYVGYETYLLPAAALGAGSSGTVLYTSGGNPDLKPERARNWSAGVEFHPVAIPSLRLRATYFNIHYQDRVTQPIAGSIASAFSTPGYASLLSYSPAASLLDTLIAGSLYGLENFSGTTYTPGGVVALVDNRNRNVARQNIQGVNLDLFYSVRLSSDKGLNISGSATYLKSNQLLTEELPETQLAGAIFNPPHWRSRVGATWNSSIITFSAYANYIGSLTDNRFASATSIRSMTTIDVVGRLSVGMKALEKPAFAIALTINNVFNRKPDVIRTTGSSDTPYDSTNFSPIGRFVGLTISRNW